jgi:DNA-binding NarL/FixJ family response regulator
MSVQAVHAPPPAPAQRLAFGEERVRVLIADHDGLARRMMSSALQQAARVVMIAAARDGAEALELASYYRPRVLLVDTALPPDGCLELIAKLLTALPEMRILTVSADDDHTALAALRAGAVGHISKDIDPAEMARLVLLAEAGEAIVPRRLITPLLSQLREVPEAGWRPLRSRLTTREWEIIELLNENTTTEHIAERLVLSPTTVYSHIKNVLRKLGVHTRQDAITAAQHLRRDEALGEKTPNPIR